MEQAAGVRLYADLHNARANATVRLSLPLTAGIRTAVHHLWPCKRNPPGWMCAIATACVHQGLQQCRCDHWLQQLQFVKSCASASLLQHICTIPEGLHWL